jgi:ubiquinone/menaquinone biosynthesis C-methylase UbiE
MKEKLSDRSFRVMSFLLNSIEFIFPYVKRRASSFGIKEGMTVVDYGCGPGRYSVHLAKMVGPTGRVHAVDLSPLAEKMVEKRAQKHGITNISFSLANGYNSFLESETADVVIALDMFFMVEKPTEFLAELYRICKNTGRLIIDDGHQQRRLTLEKIKLSGKWMIQDEKGSYLKCTKIL